MLSRPPLGVNGADPHPGPLPREREDGGTLTLNALPGQMEHREARKNGQRVSARSRTSAPGVRMESVERSP
jgi:hypothetical protein